MLAVVEAKIIEADPELHRLRCEEEQRRRYVRLSRTDEAGLRTVIARVEAGDAVWIEATVARVAEILAPQHPELNADEVRSLAFCFLGRPAELLALLLEHTEPDAEPQPKPSPEPETQPHPELEGELGESDDPFLNRALAFPADLLERLRGADLSGLSR